MLRRFAVSKAGQDLHMSQYSRVLRSLMAKRSPQLRVPRKSRLNNCKYLESPRCIWTEVMELVEHADVLWLQ